MSPVGPRPVEVRSLPAWAALVRVAAQIAYPAPTVAPGIGWRSSVSVWSQYRPDRSSDARHRRSNARRVPTITAAHGTMCAVQRSPTPSMPESTHTPARRTRRHRVWSLALLAALLAPLLTGCLRVQASMGVSSNDRVSGHLVAAVIPANAEDQGPELTVPDTLATKVRVEPYNQDGYVGSQVYFDDLTFGEVQELSGLSEKTQGMFDLRFNRAGDMVTLDGRVDLSSVPPDASEVRFTVAFPARVATTNGTRQGDSTVSWKLPAGEVSTLRAEVGYADPDTRSLAGWAGIVGGITLAVAAIVVVLAYLTRNPTPRWPSRSERDR